MCEDKCECVRSTEEVTSGEEVSGEVRRSGEELSRERCGEVR